MPIPALISAGAAIAGNIANNVASKRQNERNHAHDMEVMEYQNMINQSNLMSQRKYDSPYEQRLRLQQAGVNPFTAMEQIKPDVGANSSPLTPQNTPNSFVPFNFDFSGATDFLTKLYEFKQQEKLKKSDQQHDLKKIEQTFENQMSLQNAQQAHEMIKLNTQINADMNELLQTQNFEGNQNKLMREHQLMMQKRSERLQKDIAVLADYLSFETQSMLMKQQNEFTMNQAERDFYNKWRLENQRYYNDFNKMKYQEEKIDKRSRRGVSVGVNAGKFGDYGFHYDDY